MPVPIVAGQTRRVETDHKAGVAEADLGNQLLKTVAVHSARARLAKILGDYLHAFTGPAQTDGTIDQPVLQLGALLMLPHLVDGRLPHVDIGQLSTVRRREPFVSDVRADQHDPPPFRACRVSLALAVSARRGFEQSALRLQ
jgi:hypothetical protein